MNFELLKSKCTSSSYKLNGERIDECEREGNIFYVEGMPAFLILENGDIDPITPNGMCIYASNKEECNKWLHTKLPINIYEMVIKHFQAQDCTETCPEDSND